MIRNGMRIALSITMAFLLLISAACGSNNNGKTSESSTQPASASASQPSETTATAPETKEPVTISFMIFQSWLKDPLKDILEQIKQEENITVDLQVVPDNQFGDLLKAKIAAGDMPDLVSQNSSQVSVLGADNLADLSGEPWVSRLTRPETIKSDDGKIQMFPLKGYSFFGGVWYNKKVFQDLGLQPDPATYEDFLKLAEAVKTSGKGITPIYMSDKDSWTTQVFSAGGFSFALDPKQQDVIGQIYSNKLKLTDVPELKQVLTDFFAIYSKGYANKDHLTATWDMAKEALATDKAAMIMNGDWIVNDIKAKWPDQIGNIGHFALPYAGKQLVNTGLDIQSLFVSAKSKRLDAVKRFLDVYSQPKYQDQYYAKNPTPVPAFNDSNGGPVEEVVKAAVEKYVTSGKTAIEFGDYMPEAGSAYWDSFVPNLVAGTTDGGDSKTPDKVLAEYQKKLEEVMKLKKMPGW